MSTMTIEESLADQMALLIPTLIPTKEIYLDHEWNSRGEFNQANIVSLAESIRATGLRDAILIRYTTAYPGYKYVVVYGHRRLEAHRYLQRPLIPAKVTTLKDDVALILNVKENLEREDVNFYQQALAIGRLVAMGYGIESLKSTLKQSTTWIKQRMNLLEMPEQAQRLAAAGILKPVHVDRFLRVPSLNGKMSFLRDLKDGHKRIETGDHLLKKQQDKIDRTTERLNDVQSLKSIKEMQARIQSVFELRCPEAMTLAWAGGWISTEEYYDYLELRAKEMDRFFRRPEPIGESALDD